MFSGTTTHSELSIAALFRPSFDGIDVPSMQLMFRPSFDAIDVASCSVHPSTQFMLHDRWCKAAVQSSGGRHAFDAIAIVYLAVIIAIKHDYFMWHV